MNNLLFFLTILVICSPLHPHTLYHPPCEKRMGQVLVPFTLAGHNESSRPIDLVATGRTALALAPPLAANVDRQQQSPDLPVVRRRLCSVESACVVTDLS